MKYLSLLITPLLFLACSQTTPIPKESVNLSNEVSQEYINSIDFHGKELIIVPVGDEFYYIHKNGKKMLALTYEGSADKFSDGLARTRVKGKVGFFNKNLEMVLKPVYDYAFPFHKGKAEICTGCQEKRVDGTTMLEGGTWKQIDRSGLIIE